MSIRGVLIALDSITSAANLQANELVSNILESCQLSVQSVIGNVNDVFFATSIAVGAHISEITILYALMEKFDTAVEALPSELLTLIPLIEEIC